MKVTKIEQKPTEVPPPTFTIELSLDEIRQLQTLLGQGIGIINGLYYKIASAGIGDHLEFYHAEPRGMHPIRIVAGR